MRHELRLFFIALQFFTRLPVPRWVGFEPDWLHQSARYFPAVGLLVGAVAAAAYALAHAAWGPAVAAWVCIASTVLLTGAFHEDGWADTCDGLGGAVSRERSLQIMKDSRIGAYGAIGLVVLLGLKAATLASLPVVLAVAALLLAHTASRTAAVWLIHRLPYAGDAEHAKAKPLAQQVSAFGAGLAMGWSLAVGVALVAWNPLWWPAVLAASLAAALVTAWTSRWLRRRLGGVTGDTLGATQQLVEVAMLLAWLMAVRW